ncbi:hypothetical protein [Halopseudomonas aestusnigri]|uniref:Uncharacterized protein n=1 Tax=Halopseudomonas aestusnigri TaxID=857252 RepID=A0AAQ1G411_9GAMM|nr:hypothetical protein [Halopseudomonas aestusnigri]SEF47485.1 hypothetical protein SAMN05216586_101138 [Halopseudomonas aestusnigri]
MNALLQKSALYIKGRPEVFRVIGAVFFVATLIAAVFWLANYNAEPIAFALSLISSIFFGLPYAAEAICPNRKLVRDMSHEEILSFMAGTDPKLDWGGVSKAWSSERFLKEDPRLRMVMRYDEEGVQNPDFVDVWANKWLHPKATGYWCDIYYDHNLIDRLVLVSVDDGNCLLPTPRYDSNKVPKLNYFCAQCFDSIGSFDIYFSGAGFVREDV